ncbi:DUF1549 domain-containing protein [Planctomycetaceae bacterium SH139]
MRAVRSGSVLRLIAMTMFLLFPLFVNSSFVIGQQTGGEVTRAINLHFGNLANKNQVAERVPVSDQVMLRRVTLDIIGRVPLEVEAREYFRRTGDEKYERLVERLLASPEFGHHMSVQLRNIWLPQLETQEFQHLIGDYQGWLRTQINQDTPYDQLVRLQLTSPVGAAVIPTKPLDANVGSPVFLAAADFDPAQLAANSARSFLGLNIDCAQCHDHPFARWSQEDFWQTAAFFSRRQASSLENSWSIQIEGTDRVVRATFLDDTPVTPRQSELNQFQQGRHVIAQWITAPENQFFAANAVNRIWTTMFGQPLVSPADDLTEAPNHPHGDLLRELGNRFKSGGYAIKPMVRAIALSDIYRAPIVYPLDSRKRPSAEVADTPLAPRFLTRTQLVNSIRVASGLTQLAPVRLQQSEFAREFSLAGSLSPPRSTVQALMMMNGELIGKACNPRSSPLIQTIASSPLLNHQQRIRAFFLRTLTRYPTTEELQEVLRLVEDQRAQGSDVATIYADLFWVMLNTVEFQTTR